MLTPKGKKKEKNKAKNASRPRSPSILKLEYKSTFSFLKKKKKKKKTTFPFNVFRREKDESPETAKLPLTYLQTNLPKHRKQTHQKFQPKFKIMVEHETLIEERESQIVLPINGKPSFRIAHFLKPSIPSSKQAQTLFNPPPNPDPTKPISPILKSLSSKVHFYGWRYPLKNWNSWVKKLRPSFESTWKNASIFEAIMASTFEIPKCRMSVFALAEKWCSETSTFVLPWGEVTITLEDVLVLGGFSVTGDSVLSEIRSKELLEIEESLLVARSELIRTKSKKASQQQWMDMWMGKGRAFEHEAFLCLWLSSDTMENAWTNYNKPIGDMKLYRPPKLFESGVTPRYLDWWKKFKVVKESSSFEIKKEGISITLEERLRIKKENNEADVPPGFSPKGKRVAAEPDNSVDQHKPSPKRSRQSLSCPVIDIESSESDASPATFSQTKGVRVEVDSDDDHLTLTELFKVTGTERTNKSGQFSKSCGESPISSAGDNDFRREKKNTEDHTRLILPAEEVSRKGLTVEDGTESKDGSSVRSPISIDKNEVQTSFNGALESPGIDLLDRIARLQRIVDMVKAAKIVQV
ncbi:uncharacterized protein [Spinacia oleracea]|uniref:Uncharacterized protein isoform X2 n=1 Tax=Spinacia oleracea TaxID=3562 RepID=A0ABM3QIH2_SPIOL|nr:uncharacterized protein LOC110797967 isoform X2 [Spinacia oleracea]